MGVDHPGNLNQEIANLRREVRRLAKMTMQNAAIGRAGLRVYDGGKITIEDGGLDVTGTATIVGVLTGNGQFIWTGPVTISGATGITGPLTIEGATDITGDLDVTGATEITGPLSIEGATDITGDVDMTGDMDLTGDLNVVSSGRIKAGGMTIDPSTNGGTVGFTGGKSLHAAGSAFGLYNGSDSSLVLNASSANLVGPGCSFIAGSVPRISSLPTINRTTIGSPPVGTVYADASGNLYRAI